MTAAAEAQIPRVFVVTLGGTIAMSPAPEGSLSIGADVGALVATVAHRLPVSIETEMMTAMPSSQLRLSNVIELGEIISHRLSSGRYAGAVVTQGTDTLEESAFALDLLIDSPRPVVVTGAMRAPGQPGSEAQANLLAAITVAASEAARGLGTLVVMNDDIHAARLVRKSHTMNPAAFVSTPGTLGWLSEGQVRFVLVPARRPRLPARPRSVWNGSVPLVSIGIGDDGAVFQQLLRRPPDGLVVAALGAGHVPAEVVATLSDLASRLPVVLSTRVGTGEIPNNAYDFPGSERDLLHRGLVSGEWLDAWKCRVLLELLLRSGDPSPRVSFHEIVQSGVLRS